ncbi:hypothetical protein [Bradyrhizobium sp. SZCCHNR2009]|uniref:hypothetical protein n=1 Tax=Bradyrhizobium sp. SZCCHNR2009 TaxID=3057375 RepID=UPI0028F0DA6D|nr:hypothetical protein [Bradyrhizobium sp. SZCCHNR2009]
MADAEIPSSWSSAGRNALGNTLWILPLVTFERVTEGHYNQAAILGAAWIGALILAVKLHVVEELASSHERRSQLLTWACIIAGAMLLGLGIYRLSSPPVLQNESKPISQVIEDKDTQRTINDLSIQVREMSRDLAKANRERDEALSKSASAAPPSGGPIIWNSPEAQQLFVVSWAAEGFVVNGALFWGTSTESVSITEAYVTSGLTGHKLQLQANVANKGYFPVDKVDIPPGAPVHLDAVWNPPIPIKDFMNEWGKFRAVIVYNGTRYERDYDLDLVRKKLQEHAPSMFGPQMTPREDK